MLKHFLFIANKIQNCQKLWKKRVLALSTFIYLISDSVFKINQCSSNGNAKLQSVFEQFSMISNVSIQGSTKSKYSVHHRYTFISFLDCIVYQLFASDFCELQLQCYKRHILNMMKIVFNFEIILQLQIKHTKIFSSSVTLCGKFLNNVIANSNSNRNDPEIVLYKSKIFVYFLSICLKVLISVKIVSFDYLTPSAVKIEDNFEFNPKIYKHFDFNETTKSTSLIVEKERQM